MTMTRKPKPICIAIAVTQAERDALERYRAANGLRSLNAAVRRLIELADKPS